MTVFRKLLDWWQPRKDAEYSVDDHVSEKLYSWLAGWSVSLLLHAGLLLLFMSLTLILPPTELLTLSASSLPEEPALVPEAFEFSDFMTDDVGALADGGTATASPEALVESEEVEIAVDLEPIAFLGDLPATDLAEPILAAPNATERVALQGEGVVGITGASGAIDRITNEIILSLEQRQTLVIWLFDESGSLVRQREEIITRFDRVYEELGVIEAAENPAFARHKDKPLLTVVASFGESFHLLTKKPTDNIDLIKTAVHSVNNDTSGIENVFSAIGQVAQQHRHYRLRSPRRNVLIVVLTDEAGDDVSHIDDTVALCQKLAMPVFVVGIPAPFGRQDAYVRYVDPDPDFDQRTQWAPVHHGPESVYPERLRLEFSGLGRDEGMLDSGFGPFGLTRLTYETGGVYFAVHPNRETMGKVRRRDTAIMSTFVSKFFDPLVMRRYRPNYVAVAEYRRLLSENSAREALVSAAQLSWASGIEDPRVRFPKVNDAEFSRDLSRAQRDAAELEPILNRLVANLQRGEPDRPKLVSPRWQAGYDLAMGRALAAKVRAEGYNAMLAQAKQGIAFEKEKSDSWVLRPADEILSGSVLANHAERAIAYLQRVVDDHQETPWAMLAKQELAVPLGWEWQERFFNVAQRREQENNNDDPPRPELPPEPPSKELRKPPAL